MNNIRYIYLLLLIIILFIIYYTLILKNKIENFELEHLKGNLDEEFLSKISNQIDIYYKKKENFENYAIKKIRPPKAKCKACENRFK
tara:strand:- start:882 stop:1142 length:261 start_codon:yes stop_codon:yes gene_type:complete